MGCPQERGGRAGKPAWEEQEREGPRCSRGRHRRPHDTGWSQGSRRPYLPLEATLSKKTGQQRHRLDATEAGCQVPGERLIAQDTSSQDTHPKGAGRSTEPRRGVPFPGRVSGERLKCKLMQRNERGRVRRGRPVCCATEGREEAGPRRGGGPCQGGPPKVNPKVSGFQKWWLPGAWCGNLLKQMVLPSRSDGL